MATARPPSTPPPRAASGASPASRPSRLASAAASPRVASAMRTPGSAVRIMGLRWPREGDAAASVRLQAHVRGLLQRRRRLKAQDGRRVVWAFVDSRIHQTMFDHQRTGVRWLFGAYSRGGGILGDDPGLGKTIQVLAVLEAVIRARLATRVLVVAPANLVKNWASEFNQWVGKGVLSVVALSPDDATGVRAADRLAALTAVPPPRPNHLDARGLSPHMVVIISYETLHAHGSVLRSCAGVDLLVADEAHRLRNGGERALALRAVPAASRLLLTATYISNCMEDFYTLVDLARPGRLGTRLEFEMDISAPLAAGRRAGASHSEVALAELAAEWKQDVAADVMLRRTGADLDRGLPQRHDFILMCRPTTLQRRLHAAAVEAPGLGALAKLGALRVIHTYPLLLNADEVRGRGAGQDGGARSTLPSASTSKGLPASCGRWRRRRSRR